MKKKLISSILSIMAISVFATEVTYKDVTGADSHNIAKLNVLGITPETKSEIKDLKYADAYLLAKFAKANNICAEVDAFVASSNANVRGKFDPIHVTYEVFTKKNFPLWFTQVVEKQFAASPSRKSIYLKYGVFYPFDFATASEIITCINNKEFTPALSTVNNLNGLLAKAGLKQVKKYLRSKGKTFVAKKTVVDGKEVIENPLELPMKELTDALNAPRYAGLNEWITKYEADWEKIDVSSWLPTPEQMAETMNAILIDETKLDKHALNLRFHLGVDGFNAFIKEYNEGTVQ